MSEDETADDGDWFERALAEGEERPVDGDVDEEDRPEDATSDEDDVEAATPASDGEATADDVPSDAMGNDAESESTVDDATGDVTAEDPDDDVADEDRGGTDSDASPDTPAFDAVDPDGDELDAAFEQAAAAAEEPTDEPDDASATGESAADFGSEAADGADPFGGESGDFGMGVEGESGDDELFDDDFGAAFGGGGGDDEFDDEDFESAIPRLDIGIAGLDRMIQGGVPERHLITTIGGAGTGKTTFGLQYLNHGLQRDENGVFITLEQSHDAILDTAAEHDFDFEAYEKDDRLAVVDLDPVEMANSLDNIRAELPTLVEEFGADRFVLDSVSLLEMMYDEQARRRTEIFDFTRSLKRAGVTTLLTSEADEDNPYASRHGIIEYLTDAVFLLQYVRGETNETRLAVEIQKIRNANHSRETKPYEITAEGISVYEQANIF